LLRASGFDPDSHRIDGLRIFSDSERQEMALVASVPLTAEAWLPLGEGEVLALRAGKIVARVG
jgi:glutamine amidotransferase